MILRVETPVFVAGAIWEKCASNWRCVHAAPILRWMIGKTPQEVKRFLEMKRYSYQWLK